MSYRCNTLFWCIELREGAKEKTVDWGRRGLLLRSRNTQPPYNWAKRNAHSDPPHPSGAIKVATTSPSNTPTKLERRNKQVSFFNTISGCSSFFLAKCRTSLLCLLNLFLCHAPSIKSFGIQNMYLCMRCLKDRNHIVQQRWALQQKVAKAIADKRCSVAGLLPLITQVKASCQEAHRLRAGKHFTLVVHLVRDCALERAKRARVRLLPSPTSDAHWITMCTSLLHSISNKEESFSKDPPFPPSHP